MRLIFKVKGKQTWLLTRQRKTFAYAKEICWALCPYLCFFAKNAPMLDTRILRQRLADWSHDDILSIHSKISYQHYSTLLPLYICLSHNKQHNYSQFQVSKTKPNQIQFVCEHRNFGSVSLSLMDYLSTSTNPSSSGFSSAGNNNKEKKPKGGKRSKGVKLSTDPQSVAARERRHRISDRFKILQSLVPGGSKMDTVSMLEEAIHYVKFLKTQIWLHQTMINFVDEDPSLYLAGTYLPPQETYYAQNVLVDQVQPSELVPHPISSSFQCEEPVPFDTYVKY